MLKGTSTDYALQESREKGHHQACCGQLRLSKLSEAKGKEEA